MEKDKYKIRQARIDDAVRVRELLKTWLPESPYNFGNVNNKKLLDHIIFSRDFLLLVFPKLNGASTSHVFNNSRILTASSIRANLILYLSFSIWSYIDS